MNRPGRTPLGRPVHYRTDADPSVCQAGIVVVSNTGPDDEHVALVYFNTLNDTVNWKHQVSFDPTRQPGSWHWPCD